MTLTLPAGPDWTTQAACVGDWDLFYPESRPGRGNHKATAYAPALAICRACPVEAKVPCLAAALEHETTSARYGVWGGTTPEQRDLIARKPT